MKNPCIPNSKHFLNVWFYEKKNSLKTLSRKSPYKTVSRIKKLRLLFFLFTFCIFYRCTFACLVCYCILNIFMNLFQKTLFFIVLLFPIY